MFVHPGTAPAGAAAQENEGWKVRATPARDVISKILPESAPDFPVSCISTLEGCDVVVAGLPVPIVVRASR